MATGKRAGSRRAAKPRRGLDSRALKYAAGITVCIVAWGYLVFMAIDFGASARSGDGAAWMLLALASLGAIACLFIGLMLASGLVRVLGVGSTETPSTSSPSEPPPPRTPGGRRAAR